MTVPAEDRDRLFQEPPSRSAAEEPSPALDSSTEAMRRLRFPFEADQADVIEQQQDVPEDEDDYRR